MKIRATILIETNDPSTWSGQATAQDIVQAAQLIQAQNLTFTKTIRVISIREEQVGTRDGAARGAT